MTFEEMFDRIELRLAEVRHEPAAPRGTDGQAGEVEIGISVDQLRRLVQMLARDGLAWRDFGSFVSDEAYAGSFAEFERAAIRCSAVAVAEIRRGITQLSTLSQSAESGKRPDMEKKLARFSAMLVDLEQKHPMSSLVTELNRSQSPAIIDGPTLQAFAYACSQDPELWRGVRDAVTNR